MRLSITVTAPQHDWLKLESEKLGISIADVIRRIVDSYRIDWKQPTDYGALFAGCTRCNDVI